MLDGLQDRPVIGDWAEIGAAAVIVERVLANAFVGTKDLATGAVVDGVRAKLIRMREGFFT